MEARAKVCIDRILPADMMRHQETVASPGGRVRAISPRGKAWNNGSTLRVRFIGGTQAERHVAITQAGWWSAVANLHFDFNDAPDAELRIAFDASDGAWSYVGTDCRSIPLDQPTMNLGFLDGGTAAHEFGHAIGLAHEHQSPFGGIQWNEQVVIREMARSPNFWNEATTRHNILFKYTLEQVNGTDFDPESIMLYFFPASWTINGVETRANEVLSSLDKQFIAGAKMYPRSGPSIDHPTMLKVGAARRTRASIGKPGEQDIYQFVVSTPGMHVIDTQGPTDVVMKLFGPDSTTSLIATDDDSGLGTNARIAMSLSVGNYYAQVRHFDAAATGDYTIRVRRA